MRGRLRDYEARLDQEFAHESYMSQLSGLRDRLKLALSDHPPEGEKPSAEIAADIQALRATITVEEAPHRQARASTAEIPVTARIRKKKPVAEEPAEKPPEEPRPVQEIILPVKPVDGYRGQVTSRRQRSEAQLRLF